MELNSDHRVRGFMTRMLSKVSLSDAHREIELEYLAHIEDSVQLAISYGLTESQAVEQTLEKMGSPENIGISLNSVHTSKWDVALLTSTLALCLIGFYALSSFGLAGRQALWTLVGLLIGWAIIRVRPLQLTSMSPAIYIAAIAVLAWSHFVGVQYDGQVYLALGSLKIKIVELSVVVFLISICGFIFRPSQNKRWNRILVAILATLPLAYYSFVQAPFSGTLYLASVFTLFASARSSWKVSAGLLSAGLLLVLNSAKTSLVNSENFHSLRVTERHTDFIFSSLMQENQWLAPLCLISFALLLARLIFVTAEIKNPFSRALSRSTVVLIAVGTFWAVTGSLGYMPMPQAGVTLPLLSYGGSSVIAHLALLGLVLGFLKRKSLHLS